MTTRERRMSIGLIGFILVAGVGFFGYQFVVAPLQAKRTTIAALEDDISQREARIARVHKRQPDLEKWKKLSLPPDKVDPAKAEQVAGPGKSPSDNARADLAQRSYLDELSTMLKASGYADADVTIIPKKPDAKNVPQLATKKPIYTKLQFTVQLKGDLGNLVDFMDRFYKVRLLHQIHDMSIIKPIGADLRAAPGAAPSTDLDVTMTVEALVLDTAEQRKTLLPDKPVDVPPLLTRTEAQYAMIPGKNIFFGPMSTGSRDSSGSGYIDTAPFVRLNGITSGPNGFEAALHDLYHNWEYKITPRSLGGFQVEAHYTLGNRTRVDSERSGKTLALRDSDGAIVDEWLIVRIDPREVILRDDVKGKYYVLHMGDKLDQRKELSKTELETLGIKPEPPKAPPKSTVIDPDDP